MTTRREFIKLSAAGASLLASPVVARASQATTKPIVISTWNFGLPANEAAWKILSSGGRALDAVEAGAKVPEGDPNVTTVGLGGFPDRDGRVTLTATQASIRQILAEWERQGHMKVTGAEKITFYVGGKADDSEGWFVRPTIIVTTNPAYRTLCEELFGPVLTVHVYDERQWLDTLELVDRTSPYALTGAIFAQDRYAIEQGMERLRSGMCS